MTADIQARAANWIQFALLLVAILLMALHGEGRLSRMEQKLEDGDRDRTIIQDQLNRIETEIATWHSTSNRFQRTQ